MTKFFISIQGGYQGLYIALFCEKICIQEVFKNDKRASSELVPYVQELLQEHNLTLHDCAFIAVDRGPGAFTSLRVVLATVNGIGLAANKPLIGVNGLQALSDQVKASIANEPKNLALLLNAYNDDVYYALEIVGNDREEGCEKIQDLLSRLKADYPELSFIFAGNAVGLHADKIKEALPHAQLHDEFQVATAEFVGLRAYQDWLEQKNITTKVEPLYLKTQYFSLKKPPL